VKYELLSFSIMVAINDFGLMAMEPSTLAKVHVKMMNQYLKFSSNEQSLFYSLKHFNLMSLYLG
jgi:hypothetical protein